MDRPQAVGLYLGNCAVALQNRAAARSCLWQMLTKGQARVVVGSAAAQLFQTRTVTGATRHTSFFKHAQPRQLSFTSSSYLIYEQSRVYIRVDVAKASLHVASA